MNIHGLLFIVMVIIGTLFFERTTANVEDFFTVTYEDIEYLNATCPESDNCTEERFFDNLEFFNCNCEDFCTQYDTCCVDSKHRNNFSKVRNPKCMKVYGLKPVFMIGDCDPNWFGDYQTEKLCTASAEEEEDLFLAIPVTNHKTGTTYKNYYCAVCNSETGKDQLTVWNVSLQSVSKDVMSSPLPELSFNRTENVWIIGNGTESIANNTVSPIVKIPKAIKQMVRGCIPNVISRCAEDWKDTVVGFKCDAYMAIIGINASDGQQRIYRNPHCAVCNYESLDKKYCSNWGIFTSLTRGPSNTFFARYFSLYDKENKCGDDKVYDTIANKCRKVFNN